MKCEHQLNLLTKKVAYLWKQTKDRKLIGKHVGNRTNTAGQNKQNRIPIPILPKITAK